MFRYYHRTKIISAKARGTTLLEILVALTIAAMIAVPAFYLYQQGLKSSVSGVVALDILAEGKRITAQLHDDLKNSCIPYHGAFALSFADLLNSTVAGDNAITGAEYALYRFSHTPVFVKKGFSMTANLLRPLISVRYSLEQNGCSDLFKLIRIETAPGAPDRIRVLSEKVCLFRITPVKVTGNYGSESWLWNVSLQLANTRDAGAENDHPASFSGKNGSVGMDFYDVVYSDFFSAICQNPLAARNWNSGLSYSPE